MVVPPNTISVTPIIDYPSQPVYGQDYELRVDLRPSYTSESWPYPEEEYVLECRVTSSSNLSVEAVDEPTVLLDRFGSAFGPALFVVRAHSEQEATEQSVDTWLRIEMITEWGLVAFAHKLSDIQVQSDSTTSAHPSSSHEQSQPDILHVHSSKDSEVPQPNLLSTDGDYQLEDLEDGPFNPDSLASRSGLHGRSSYFSALYVNRKDSPERNMFEWLAQRLNRGAKPIYRLEGPPGIGKTWILEHFIDLHQKPLADVVVIIGPLTPPEDYTTDWIWREIVERHILKPPYSIPLAQIQRNHGDSFQDSIFTLVDDLEKAAPGRHFLFVLDDVNQAPDLAVLEEKLIEPIAILSDNRHPVSLLIAMRTDIGFTVVDALRRPSRFIKQLVTPFNRELARQQLALLLHFAPAGPSGLQPDEILNSLPDSYTWGIAALNAVLARAAQDKPAGGGLTLSPPDLVHCILGALRLDSVSGPALLTRIHAFRRSQYPGGWQIFDVQDRLKLPELDASSFRDRLSDLDLIERPPGMAFGTYQLTDDWNSIFECLPDDTFATFALFPE